MRRRLAAAFTMVLVMAISFLAIGQQGQAARRAKGNRSSASAGKSVYQSNCAICHGAKGDKIASMLPKVRKMSSSQVQQFIKNGGKGMPAFSKKLSGQQVRSVADYTKKLASVK